MLTGRQKRHSSFGELCFHKGWVTNNPVLGHRVYSGLGCFFQRKLSPTHPKNLFPTHSLELRGHGAWLVCFQ